MSEAGTIPVSLDRIYPLNPLYMTKSSYDNAPDKKDKSISLREWIDDADIYSTPLIKQGTVQQNNFHNIVDTFSLDASTSNKNRIKLLARKYISGKLSDEDEARLEIEKERVKYLIPLVTKNDIKKIGDILTDIQKIQKKHNKIRKSLGLSE